MSLFKRRLLIVGTVAFLIAASTFAFAVIMSLAGTVNLSFLAFVIVAFNIVQRLLAPHLIGALYNDSPVPLGD
jgi:hypothetical protein